MTETGSRPVPRRDDLQLLLEDLACACGALSEIMTTWRRAQPGRPELRPGRLVRLQDDARRLAADLEAAAPGDRARCAAGRLAALEEEAAAIRAATARPGCPGAGDRGLQELLAAALRRAQARLADGMPLLMTVHG
jgi:hypothetical protein